MATVSIAPSPLNIGIDGTISGGSTSYGGGNGNGGGPGVSSSVSTPSSVRFPPQPLNFSSQQNAMVHNSMTPSPSLQHPSPYVVQAQVQTMSMGINSTLAQGGNSIPPPPHMSPYPQQQYQSPQHQHQQAAPYYYQQNVMNGGSQVGSSAGYAGPSADSPARMQGRPPTGAVNGGHPGQMQGRQASYNGQAGSFEYANGADNAGVTTNGNGNATAGPSRNTSGRGGPAPRPHFDVHELFRSNPGSAPNPYANAYQPRPSVVQNTSYGPGGGSSGGIGGGTAGMQGGVGVGNPGGAANQSPYPMYMGNPGPLTGAYVGIGMGMNPPMQQNPYQSMPPNGYQTYGGMDSNYQYAYPYPQYPHQNPYYPVHPNNPYVTQHMHSPQHIQQHQHYHPAPPQQPQLHQIRQPVTPSPTTPSAHASPYPTQQPVLTLPSSSHPPPQELVPELVPPPPITNISAFSPPSMARVADLPRTASVSLDEQELSKTPVFASIMRNQRATPPTMVPLRLPEQTLEAGPSVVDETEVKYGPEPVIVAAVGVAPVAVGKDEAPVGVQAVELVLSDPVAGEFVPGVFLTSRQPNSSEGLTFFASLRIPTGTPTKALAKSAAASSSSSPSASERQERRNKAKGRSQEKEVGYRRGLATRKRVSQGDVVFGDFPAKAELASELSSTVRGNGPPITQESSAAVVPQAEASESVATKAYEPEASVLVVTPVSILPSTLTPVGISESSEVITPAEIAAPADSVPIAVSVPPPVPVTPAKPPIKSWAALVRGPVKATPQTTVSASPTINGFSSSVPSSLTSPDGSPMVLPAMSALPSPSAPGTPAAVTPYAPPNMATGGPAPQSGYAAAAAVGALTANGAPAWGAAGRFTYEDMGRLLLEGVLDAKALVVKANNSPRGLINTGNMCFANSILQVLAYCLPFAGLFEELGRRVTADLGRRTPLIEAMVIFLREFIALDNSEAKAQRQMAGRVDSQPVPTGRREPFVPTYVYEAMRENKRFDSMRRGHQEDAEEFLGFFLETLHEELLYLYSRHQSRGSQGGAPSGSLSGARNTGTDVDEREVARPVSPSASHDDGWLEVGKKQKVNVVRTTQSKDSAISRIFGGKLRSVLHTPGQKDSITLEPYQPLQLEISPPNVITVTDALIHLNEAEVIPGVWSDSRKAQVDATKQTFIEILPEMLVLHLKRFTYDGERVVKKGKPIAYGPELVIPAEVMSPPRRAESHRSTYKLIGVVYHHGKGASGGHYTSCVLKQDGTGWLHLDDEAVTEVTLQEVVVTRDAALKGETGTIGYAGREKCPYLLFYQLAE